MGTVILGAHDALSGYKPLHWWGWLTVPFARCQSKSVLQLIEAGVRCFDVRVRYDECAGCWRGCHGLLTTRADAMEALSVMYGWCLHHDERIWVRLIHERGDADYEEDMRFRRLCDELERQWGSRLVLFEGRRKGGWVRLYDFGREPHVVQQVGSMAADAHWWERLVPWLYARRTRGAAMPECDIVLRDFV